MNKLLYTLMILMFISCGDWLEVSPNTEKDREDLIESENGFKQMLYGTYINMIDPSLYGHHLSYGFIEGVALNSTHTYFSNWNYVNDDRDIIDDVWSKMYNTIANINSILDAIDDKKDLFVNDEGDILQAEALAMRAFLHFDLLRMFAPNYGIDKDAIAIPYVETYERVRYPHLKTKDVIEKVITDLNRAEKLFLDANDPILTALNDKASGKDDFMANRQYRFNYWAVLALKARVYLYAENQTEAKSHALKVVNDGPFSWVNPPAITDSTDVVFMSELICALNVPKLPDYYDLYFGNNVYTLGDSYYDYTTSVFDDLNDYRYLYLMVNDDKGRKSVSGKYKQATTGSSLIKKSTVPLLRLGEMYLILAECNVATDKTEAIRLLRLLRFHRGYLNEDRNISDSSSETDLLEYICKEVRKEMFMEGQTFFTYKRMNMLAIPGFNPFMPGATQAISLDNYVFPMPESEKEYGNIPSIE